jgi:hypothetical protein
MADNTNQGIIENYLDAEADLAEAIARTPLEIKYDIPGIKTKSTLKEQLEFIKSKLEKAGIDTSGKDFNEIGNLEDIIRILFDNRYRNSSKAILINHSIVLLQQHLKRLKDANEARAKASGVRPGMFSKLGRFAGLFGGSKSRKARKTMRSRTRRA